MFLIFHLLLKRRLVRPMATQKPISTISYNSESFLKEKLDIWLSAHIIQAYQYIFHKGEDVVGEKWQFVTSHTARKSFATNVYLRCRDIFLISKYMGHSSVDMTATYIMSVGDAPEEVKQYFEKFK